MSFSGSGDRGKRSIRVTGWEPHVNRLVGRERKKGAEDSVRLIFQLCYIDTSQMSSDLLGTGAPIKRLDTGKLVEG